ncbi:IS1/IS1595 family N-terminal zinc-binding domain-containing protein [Fulvivirga lutea]|uniref:IS1 family transposase n=1 Tax=Fulvivirga lutea TaxID=2810512 RepID=A0A974WJU3_9BACT|nr:helix-turn-helix domain-containing protein [Fulvivirga lutea]QSE98477.1 IS1 family transposase [Fulvivirga lutea]
MRNPTCPKCESTSIIKSGIVNDRQRFKCKKCAYNFTVSKLGKEIDPYFVIKALQLYLEGISYREIERILGVSHVSVMNWVKKYKIKPPERYDYHPTYKILSHAELSELMASPGYLKGSGMLITELGDKFMVIKWDRFKD